jgi:LDH2 family malate/lactate/ureidoglycolate dehydrogenase
METPHRVRLTVAEARALGVAALLGAGYGESDAAIITDHVVDAALCGYEYSGLPKILNVVENPRRKKPVFPLKLLHETPLSAMYDGGNNNGMITMYHATKSAIAKASASGMSIVAMTNTWTSGRNGYYVEMIARADLVGMHTVSSGRHVAPPGGITATLGTNPIAFGFPCDGDPLVIDIGTSAFMATDLALQVRLGRQLPDGVAIDPQGRPTRDPVQARLGALLPFGGHRGYALAVAIEALGVLAGSALNPERDYGYLILAIRPDILEPGADFRRDMKIKLDMIRATPRQPGVEEIRIPSDRSFRERRRNMQEGLVIDRKIHDALTALCG